MKKNINDVELIKMFEIPDVAKATSVSEFRKLETSEKKLYKKIMFNLGISGIIYYYWNILKTFFCNISKIKITIVLTIITALILFLLLI